MDRTSALALAKRVRTLGDEPTLEQTGGGVYAVIVEGEGVTFSYVDDTDQVIVYVYQGYDWEDGNDPSTSFTVGI